MYREHRKTAATFAARVAYAAEAIKRREDSRALDDCFEMNDGAYVVTALMRRAITDTALRRAIAAMFTDQPAFESVPWHKTARALAHIPDHRLEDAARRERARAAADFQDTARYWQAGKERPDQLILL